MKTGCTVEQSHPPILDQSFTCKIIRSLIITIISTLSRIIESGIASFILAEQLVALDEQVSLMFVHSSFQDNIQDSERRARHIPKGDGCLSAQMAASSAENRNSSCLRMSG